MQRAKETVRTLLDRLPDDCSLEEVLYQLYVMQAVEAGLADVRAGNEVPHEEVVARLREVFAELHRELAAPRGPAPLEAEIDRVYDELGELVAKSAGSAPVMATIDLKRQQLRALQEQEAATARRRAESRLHLQPGQGYAALARAARLLAE